ncbi:hypothetical protein [Devosia sp.]|uniref:hypothetical protein n=1 Tax=Devosia sp. TaxID=1871048 RepID=UPI003263C126
MGQRMIIGEVVRALCVLALLFLNFGHAQAVQVAYTTDLTPYVLSDQAVAIVCQQTGQDNPELHHQPCHACRIGGSADLPPAPCLALPAFVMVAAAAHAPAPQPVGRVAYARTTSPRAPPIL